MEDRTNYSEYDLKHNRHVCADDKKGKFPNEEANLEPSKRINGSMSENLDGVTLNEAPIPTNVQALITTPSANLVTATELDSTNMKTSKKKKCSVTKKKATPKEDHQVKSCGMLLGILPGLNMCCIFAYLLADKTLKTKKATFNIQNCSIIIVFLNWILLI